MRRLSDTDLMVIAMANHRAEELGVKQRGTHELLVSGRLNPIDPLNQARRLWCSCGWEKTISAKTLLTTQTPVFLDALTEHALSQTDPTHYTYYPRHAEHGRSN